MGNTLFSLLVILIYNPHPNTYAHTYAPTPTLLTDDSSVFIMGTVMASDVSMVTLRESRLNAVTGHLIQVDGNRILHTTKRGTTGSKYSTTEPWQRKMRGRTVIKISTIDSFTFSHFQFNLTYIYWIEPDNSAKKVPSQCVYHSSHSAMTKKWYVGSISWCV